MKAMWSLTVDDYLEIVKRAQAKGIKTGKSMESVFVEYMKEKGKKPIGHTELTQDEIIKEQTSHGKKVLNIETNKDRVCSYRIYERK